ncbi:receptor-type tyrosine-protein phosphatase delta-like [Diorhabda sublineata]|uniref:receptor-type tyrosine-protein phosphatase delta-like n=1 Tax=Diorhabda sublineata TaxID=1163346 RepID=UPI0024E0C420|nr:receptor-type tyrosine-protein phosphatase delta-like [Diorhabda sublineata]
MQNVLKIFFFILWLVYYVQSEDKSIFMLANNYCITNSSSAIVFTEKNTEFINRESLIYPALSVKSFDCMFDNQNKCHNEWFKRENWYIQYSHRIIEPEIITDRRWERFKTWKTYDPKKGNYTFDLVLNVEENMSIPLSINTDKGVHIYICDGSGTDPPSSKCYWIQFGAYDRNQSILRKCDSGYIPDRYGIWAQDNCKLARDMKLGDLFKNTWNHFVIQKFEKLLRVFQNNEEIMKYIDYEFFVPKKMYIRSDGNSSWKIHTYYFLESRSARSIDLIGPRLKPTDKKICVSMFIKTSINTNLTIRIKSKQSTEEINETFSTNGKWQEIKLYKNNMSCDEYDMYFAQLQSKNNYWAIDDVRECSETEYRYIQGDSDNLSCQRIEDSGTITVDKKKELSTDIINCESNSFGRDCIPCLLFGEESCGQFKYCQLYEDTTKCFCSAGYKTTSCDKPCDDGYYDHACAKRGHCKGKYDVKNGVCSLGECEVPYMGKNCQIVDYPFFINPPEVISIGDNSFIIVQSDQQYEGRGDSYSYEYAENKTELIWISIGKFKLGTPASVIVDDIKSDTNYLARTIIFPNRKPKKYMKNDLKIFRMFTTSCKLLTEDDIHILPRNTSAEVKLSLTRASCKLYKYKFYIGYKQFDFFSQNFTILNLKPFTEYVFYMVYNGIQQIGPISFKTDEGVPTAIRNLHFNILSPKEVQLIWLEPEPKYGIIEKYDITYKVIKSLGCSSNATRTVTRKVTTFETYHSLENLPAYTQFEINIIAYTKAGPGDDYRDYFNTSATDLSEVEKINITRIELGQSGPLLYLDDLPCSNLSGPVYLKFGFNCTDLLCAELNFIYQEYIEKYEKGYVFVKNENVRFHPFANYTVKFSVSRTNGSYWIYRDTKTFQTLPDKPHQVSDLMLYSKEYHSYKSKVFIRWKPPYPPTGILGGYWITYNGVSETVEPVQCELWKEYHCATIWNHFYKGSIYYVKVKAKNKGTEYGNFLTIYFIMETVGPSSPYNITYYWKDDNLYLTMYHPNNTNGKLTSFDIQESSYDPVNKPVDKYNLTYTYKIEKHFKPCQKLDFKIRAHNIYAPGEYVKAVIKTPPNYPSIKKMLHITNTTLGVNISIDGDVNTIDFLYIILSTDKEKILNENEDITKNPNVRCKAKNITSTFYCVIGNNNSSDGDYTNPPLEPGKNYSLVIFSYNTCNGYNKSAITQEYVVFKGNNDMINKGNDELWALLLLAVPLIVFGIWYFKKPQTDLPKLSKPQILEKRDDQIALTEKQSITRQKVNIVRPKPSNVLPVLTTKHSRKIRIIDFENYVKESIENGELERQHNLFPKGLLKPHEVGSSPINKNKNRYKNLISYDHTRVKLKRPPNSEESDYINANYIDGYKKPKTYIATQGPKSNTLNDFWLMIWQTNVKYIVMLANIYENGKKKVEKYWPDINENKKYGDITVYYLSSNVFANFDIRTFTVSNNGEERQITQLHYTTWPDHGIPLYSQSLVPFLQKILKIPYGTKSPILIHCSAGVGRTGTIILSDICLRMAAGEGSIDFLAHLENLRNQRANLVDNIEQYKLAHLVVLDCLFGMRTAIPCNDDMRTIIESTLSNNGAKTQMKYILETQWQDSAMETMLEGEEVAPIYPEKNRFSDIVPKEYRVHITRYPYQDDTSSYINAVSVDGFRHRGRFIATQQPMPNTIGDFWRMVWEKSCTVIISLNTINVKDKSVCKIWPEKDEELDPVDFIKVIHKKTQRLDFYRIVTVEILASQSTTNSLIVNILAMDNWKPQDLLPNSIEEFLTYMDAGDALSRLSENVIVTCYDGARACGLYIAMSFLREKMKLEQSCDVCLAVRTIRHSRKQFITSEEQYEFLYRASLTFITGFQSYSNFA